MADCKHSRADLLDAVTYQCVWFVACALYALRKIYDAVEANSIGGWGVVSTIGFAVLAIVHFVAWRRMRAEFFDRMET